MKFRYRILAVMILISAVAGGPLFAQDGSMMPAGPHPLAFISQPPQVGRVGVPYVYTAVARAKNQNAVIRYYSESMMAIGIGNPPGFAIDSVSGVVAWTPSAPGWYRVSIIARASNGDAGFQGFIVAVTAGNGIVQGKVTDTTGAGIPGVIIEIMQADSVSALKMPIGVFSFATKTDNNGSYRLSNIEPGVYKLHAVSPTPAFASQWYDGKATPFDANRITVTDSLSPTDVTTANFVLRGGTQQMPLVKVAGTVLDDGGAPVARADIFFVHAGFALNATSTVEDFRKMFDLEGRSLDFRLEGSSVHVFHAVTDSLGAYTLKVVGGMYIAYAHARGYAQEFYNQQPDILSATRLALARDTTGIDFTLAALPPVAFGSIQGTVMDTAKGAGVRSRIVAFRDRWMAVDRFTAHRAYTVDTDTLGVYTLEDLLPGSYLVLALPLGSYAPAFYASDTGSTAWRHATRIVIDGNAVTGIDISVRAISGQFCGFTGIHGKIQAGGAGPNAAGALVYAHSGPAIAGFGIADTRGQYEIDGLTPGSYTVTADLPGYDPAGATTAVVSYTQAGAPQFATADLTMSGAATSAEEASATRPEGFTLSQNYPNPFNPTTTISYRLPAAGNVDLRVYDIIGREVAVLASGVQAAGTHTVNFEASALSSGVYFYRLSAGGATAARKMLLLK